MCRPSLPIAFGLANLPMLGWLAAAAAPVLIHLLSRRRYRETTWAAMEYLLAAMKRRARKIQLEQWLLLAVRTLLIVLLVIAVAEPYLEHGVPAFLSGGRTHRVLVLDGSYSMAYKPTDQSRFQRAKELATRIVDEHAEGDSFTLVLMATPPRIVVGTPSMDAGEINKEIKALELVHTGADLPATIMALRQLIDNTRHDGLRHEVYFFTDLQRATWSPRLSEDATADFRRQTEELAKVAKLAVVDVGQPSAENLAVTALSANESVVTVDRKVGVEAELQDFGGQGRNRQPVELLVDGRRIAQEYVDVPPGGSARVMFPHRFETPGDHAVEVRAAGDALDVDNHRYLVVHVRQSLRVLCIDGRPSGERLGGAADYLATALAPRADRPDLPPVTVDVATESALAERDLAAYDCIFLADVAQFTPSEARVLDGYLAQGGNLVVFLGEQVQSESYNRELGGKAGAPRILPADLGKVIDQRQARLDPLDYQHPLVRAFKGRNRAGLLPVLINKYVKLELPENSRAKVALALANRDPLVVEETIRRGRVVLVATSADTAWTPWPVWPPSYVPLVQEILAWCVAGQSQQRNLSVGEPLGTSVPTAGAEKAVIIERPDGQSHRAPVRTDGDSSGWQYDDTLLSGFYTMRLGQPAAQTQTFAVNLNTAESDLTPITADELQNEVWSGIPLAYQTTWQTPDAHATAILAAPGRLHVGLLYAVLALLFIETFLAWRFGHHYATEAHSPRPKP